MDENWNLARIQKYISDEIEESYTLEYKAADALVKTDGKRKEITKDVSAMANSGGGIIIYGVSEYQQQDKRHLPERIDSVDQSQYSREWLEHVINNIRPRVDGLVIHPVSVADTGQDGVVYAVSVPKGTTVHQAQDHRYYKRYNFESVPMTDDEVKDVMNRATTPDVQVIFGFNLIERANDISHYRLTILVKNNGSIVVDHFKLQFTFPKIVSNAHGRTDDHLHFDSIEHSENANNYVVKYRSRDVLFPDDEEDIGSIIRWEYSYNLDLYLNGQRRELTLDWELFADNMLPRRGKIPLSELNDY